MFIQIFRELDPHTNKNMLMHFFKLQLTLFFNFTSRHCSKFFTPSVFHIRIKKFVGCITKESNNASEWTHITAYSFDDQILRRGFAIIMGHWSHSKMRSFHLYYYHTPAYFSKLYWPKFYLLLWRSQDKGTFSKLVFLFLKNCLYLDY